MWGRPINLIVLTTSSAFLIRKPEEVYFTSLFSIESVKN
jgi:hypothetical protein